MAEKLMTEEALIELILRHIEGWTLEEVGENNREGVTCTWKPLRRLESTARTFFKNAAEDCEDRFDKSWDPKAPVFTDQPEDGSELPAPEIEDPEEWILKIIHNNSDPFREIRDIIDGYFEKNQDLLGDISISRHDAQWLLWGRYDHVSPAVVRVYKHIFPSFVGRNNRLAACLTRAKIRRLALSHIGRKLDFSFASPGGLLNKQYRQLSKRIGIEKAHLQEVIDVFGDLLSELCYGESEDFTLKDLH